MSNFISNEYNSNKIEFSKESFKVSGISFYQDKLKNINYDTSLIMKNDLNNKYDETAIGIYKEELIGYVPKELKNKNFIKDNLNKNLRIINLKSVNNIIGLRVIPEKYFEQDMIKNSFFCD